MQRHNKNSSTRFFLAAAALSAFLFAHAPALPAQSTSSASAIIEAPPLDPAAPLVVNQQSHIVVMEYEAWFGPNGITFQTSVAEPLLQSKDMQGIGGGYDSADPSFRVENFTASIATAGQDGWGCPNPEALPYCPDDALRYGKNQSYVAFDSFMNYARRLRPIFLIIHQFNEFNSSDEGWDANTNDDVEPANQWGNDLDIIKYQISLYRCEFSAKPPRDAAQ